MSGFDGRQILLVGILEDLLYHDAVVDLGEKDAEPQPKARARWPDRQVANLRIRDGVYRSDRLDVGSLRERRDEKRRQEECCQENGVHDAILHLLLISITSRLSA